MLKTKTQMLLKAAMQMNGYNQAALAKELRVSQSSISKWFKDISSASFGTVLRLCRLLDLDVNELIKED